MGKSRLEAFSDGVLAIIITIMVLELKVPHGSDLSALKPLLPIFSSYILSFVYLAIYWNNHHHMLYLMKDISASILWANMHLLFWLSLVPFVTGWMGENHFESAPTALYGFVLFMAAISYTILQKAIIIKQGQNSILARAVGNNIKGWLSIFLYCCAIPLAFYSEWMSQLIYVFVALMWLIPDRRIEKVL
jgi:uncharacterized membrane protein